MPLLRLRTPALGRALVARLAPGLAALSLTCLPVAAQGQLWGVQMGTPLKDRARAVAPDGVGGVFVAGSTFGDLGGASAGHQDVWLERRDSNGALQWQRQFGSDTLDQTIAAVSDGAGGVFLCGSTLGDLAGGNLGDFDVWLARVDAAGNTLWMRQFGTATLDSARAMASDGAGGVYLTGYSVGDYGGPSAGGWDVWLERIDALGNRLWVRQIGSAQDDFATGVTSDAAGGVFLVGYTKGDLAGPVGGGADAWRARFDSTGAELWRRQSQSPRPDSATAVAPDGSGGLIVVGSANWSSSPGTWYVQGWLARFGADGSPIWNRPLQQSYVDLNQALASDGAGGVYLYASVVEPAILPLAITVDTALSRFDPLGEHLWSRRMSSGLDPFNDPGALTGDGAGGLYACGATWEDLAATNAGESDAWLARLDG